jgi:hypothetical protein
LNGCNASSVFRKISVTRRRRLLLSCVRPKAPRRPTTQATLPSADHAAEIARLRRENERLRMERDILKNRLRSLLDFRNEIPLH